MLRMLDRYFKHRATMEILNLAVTLTRDAIFVSDKEDIAAFIARVDSTAESLAIAHVKVCVKLDEIVTKDPTDKEVAVIGTIFNRKP